MGDIAMSPSIDLGTLFARLAREQRREEVLNLGGVSTRLVRLEGGGEGRWDRHERSAEIVLVWSGDFSVELRDRTIVLAAGQCCVVPAGAEHRGSSRQGAEIVLFQPTA